jgi:hypothetical protein
MMEAYPESVVRVRDSRIAAWVLTAYGNESMAETTGGGSGCRRLSTR